MSRPIELPMLGILCPLKIELQKANLTAANLEQAEK